MKLSEKMTAKAGRIRGHYLGTTHASELLLEYAPEVAQQEARLASARAIMEKFVNKVDTGRARSKETYAEMKQWMEDE